VDEVYYINMNINNTMSQIELNKAIIQRYFEGYNNKNEAIFDEIISPDYTDHGQSAYMGSPGRGIAGAKNDVKNSLDKFEDINYTIEVMIASTAYPDLVGTYWKGSLTPNATTSKTLQSSKIIEYRGVSIHRIQNGKMVETWHVVEGWPLKIQEKTGEV
jgi:predicted ester cyclase